MKKQLITTLVTAALGAPAMAGSLSMDSRADLQMVTPNDEAAKTTDATNKFVLQTLRLDGKGNFNENTSFRLRFRLNNGSLGTKNSRDNLNDAVDFGYIQHKVMENLSFQLGKFGTDIGGIEGMTSGTDLYLTSQGYSEQSSLRFGTGVKAIYMIAGQELNLMVMNEAQDALSQTRNAAGFVYKGSFMDKALMPVLSYHQDNLQQTSTTAGTGTSAGTIYDRTYNFASAGIKYDMAPIFVELDYLYNTFKNRSFLDETDKSSTIVGTLGYRMDNFVAKLKVESAEEENFSAASTSTKNKYSGYQAAFEYLPTNDKLFRYHAAYTSRDTKPEVGETKTTQTAIVGVRLMADFLK